MLRDGMHASHHLPTTMAGNEVIPTAMLTPNASLVFFFRFWLPSSSLHLMLLALPSTRLCLAYSRAIIRVSFPRP